tara:strand:+ start:66 stop:653 length:588 start_codon:yes stop_codon:yes gene_type:complete
MKNKIILNFFLLISIIGYSCTCTDLADIPVLERINSTEQIFEGIITEVKSESEFDLTAEFLITRKIKGVNTLDTIKIRTSKIGSMCGIDFKIGQKWLIFSSSNYSGICNGNVILEKGTLNEFPNTKVPNEYKFYFSKLKNFLNKISALDSVTEITEYDQNDNVIAKGKIGKNKRPLGKWFYADIRKEDIIIEQKN